MALRVMYFHPCHGSRELLADGWGAVAALLSRHAARARSNGLTLDGWNHDNPFQKWANEDSRNPTVPTTCFDQYTRCCASVYSAHRMIADLWAWVTANNRIRRQFAANGHGTEFQVYGGPPPAGMEPARIIAAMLPFLCGREELRPLHWNDGSAALEREDDDVPTIAVQRSIGQRVGIEAVPVPSSIFNSPAMPAFATYMVAVRSQPVHCPLHVLFRGADAERPIHGDGSRGEPVPLATAARWCIEHDAVLQINVGLTSDVDMVMLAGMQGVAPSSEHAEPATPLNV